MRRPPDQPFPAWPARVVVVACAAATAMLLAAFALYASARPVGSAYLLPAWLSHPVAIGPGWRALAGSMPSFAHAFVFGLLTALLLPSRRRWIWIACLSWGLVDAAFEIAQIPALAGAIAHGLPAAFGRVPVLDHLGRYLTAGTFDPLDVLASLLAAIVAAMLLTVALQRHERTRVVPPENNRRD